MEKEVFMQELRELTDTGRVEMTKILLCYIFNPENGVSEQWWVKLIGGAIAKGAATQPSQWNDTDSPKWIHAAISANLSLATSVRNNVLLHWNPKPRVLSALRMNLELVRYAHAAPVAAPPVAAIHGYSGRSGRTAGARESALLLDSLTAENISGEKRIVKPAVHRVAVHLPAIAPVAESPAHTAGQSAGARAGASAITNRVKCPASRFCDRLFMNRQDLVQHLVRQPHKKGSANALDTMFSNCNPNSGKPTPGFESLISNYGDSIEEGLGAGDGGSYRGHSRTEEPRTLKCSKCTYCGVSRIDVQHHTDYEHNGKRRLCPVPGCAELFPANITGTATDTLREHLLSEATSSSHGMSEVGARSAVNQARVIFTICDPGTGKPTPGFASLDIRNTGSGGDYSSSGANVSAVPDAGHSSGGMSKSGLVCAVCHKFSKTNSDALRHTENVHYGKRLLCPVDGCRVRSWNTSALLSHLMSKAAHSMNIVKAKEIRTTARVVYTVCDPTTGQPTPGLGLSPSRYRGSEAPAAAMRVLASGASKEQAGKLEGDDGDEGEGEEEEEEEEEDEKGDNEVEHYLDDVAGGTAVVHPPVDGDDDHAKVPGLLDHGLDGEDGGRSEDVNVDEKVPGLLDDGWDQDGGRSGYNEGEYSSRFPMQGVGAGYNPTSSGKSIPATSVGVNQPHDRDVPAVPWTSAKAAPASAPSVPIYKLGLVQKFYTSGLYGLTAASAGPFASTSSAMNITAHAAAGSNDVNLRPAKRACVADSPEALQDRRL